MRSLRSVLVLLVVTVAGCGSDGAVPQPEQPPQRFRGGGLNPCASETLTACVGPYTGPTCSFECDGSGGGGGGTGGTTSAFEPEGLGTTGGPPEGCEYRVYCHDDEAVYGLSVFNALLYEQDPTSSDAAIESAFESWALAHPEDVGLPTSVTSLDLERDAHFRSQEGGLTVFRFQQSHAGVRVLPPDNLVNVIYNPRGAISVRGALIDADATYANETSQASSAAAEASIQDHVAAEIAVDPGDVIVENLALVAVRRLQAIGWVGNARHDGIDVARVVVSADASTPPATLELWSYVPASVAALEDEEPVETRTIDPDEDDPLAIALDLTVEDTLTSGSALQGSIYDGNGQTMLGNERIVALDLNGGAIDELPALGARFLRANGSFTATGGTRLNAQTAYFYFNDWYELVDGAVTDEGGQKRWDSAISAYANMMGTETETTPGTYQPRIAAFVDILGTECPAGSVLCASFFFSNEPQTDPIYQDFEELLHQPAGPSALHEPVGVAKLKPSIGPWGGNIVTYSHEFGHLMDLFLGPGFLLHVAPTCDAAACDDTCNENTTDEGQPLGETVAQMWAQIGMMYSFSQVGFDFCDLFPALGVSGTNMVGPGPCVGSSQLGFFARPGAPECPSGMSCDKPEDALDSHCDPNDGYNTFSIFQAFWQMLHGTRCDTTSPYACESAPFPEGIHPMDGALPAFIYSQRVNALTYQQFFDDMATYVQCNYGEQVYQEFNTIACNHGLRDCAAPPPTTCEVCGNGVREGGETCDGQDWVLPGCAAIPGFIGGTLACDMQTCQLDTSMCVEPSSTSTTSATSDSGSDESAASDADATGDDTGCADGTSGGGCADGGGGDPGGCECRALAPVSAGTWWLAGLGLLCMGARRRRR